MAVGFGQRGAFEEEDVFGVELGAAGEVVGAGDHGVVDDEDFVVHEIVAAGRGVGRGVFSDEAGAGDDLRALCRLRHEDAGLPAQGGGAESEDLLIV
jgi:hypothetical protein